VLKGTVGPYPQRRKGAWKELVKINKITYCNDAGRLLGNIRPGVGSEHRAGQIKLQRKWKISVRSAGNEMIKGLGLAYGGKVMRRCGN